MNIPNPVIFHIFHVSSTMDNKFPSIHFVQSVLHELRGCQSSASSNHLFIITIV